MPCFICTRCGCIDNTATGFYWMPKTYGEPPLCAECKDGKWHGEFEKRKATDAEIEKAKQSRDGLLR